MYFHTIDEVLMDNADVFIDQWLKEYTDEPETSWDDIFGRVLDVEQDAVGHRKKRLNVAAEHASRGIQTGVNPFVVAPHEQLADKGGLQ